MKHLKKWWKKNVPLIKPIEHKHAQVFMFFIFIFIMGYFIFKALPVLEAFLNLLVPTIEEGIESEDPVFKMFVILLGIYLTVYIIEIVIKILGLVFSPFWKNE